MHFDINLKLIAINMIMLVKIYYEYANNSGANDATNLQHYKISATRIRFEQSKATSIAIKKSWTGSLSQITLKSSVRFD